MLILLHAGRCYAHTYVHILSLYIRMASSMQLVSCAGTGSVEYSELTPVGGYTPHPFKCQTSVTYQVATLPDCSEAFLTCEEKGYIRLFDLRTASSCICEGCRKVRNLRNV